MKYKLIIIIAIILTCVGVCYAKPLNTQDEQLEPTTVANLTSTFIIEVDKTTTFTGYSLSVDETDESPCIGARNNNLCELKKEMLICASRDLPLDTVIYIDGFGECVIKDRMSKKYLNTGRIDILFDNKIDAINFGIKKLNYTIIK